MRNPIRDHLSLPFFALLALALALAPLDGGCGAGSTRRTAEPHASALPSFTPPTQPFPTRASLRTSLPPPGPTSADPGVVVAQWDIAPSSLTPPASVFDVFYERIAPQRPTAQRSEAFACFATEIARFTGANGGLPTDALRSYVAARCGVTSNSVGIAAFPVDLHGAPSDTVLLEQIGDEIVERAMRSIPEAADRVGFGFARVGSRFVAAVAAGLAETEIVPSRPVAEADHVRFGLRASLPVDRLVILANQGETAVASCTATGQAPEIAIDCPFVPDAGRSRIEIAVREGESVMLRPVAHIIALVDASSGLTYSTRAGSAASPIVASTLASTVLPLLNGIRTRAGLPALALDAAQSAANAEVAPSFFGSEDPTVIDQVMLYAMAGWDVAGTVREGRATAVMTLGLTDAAGWLYAALEEPIQRFVLLDPEARVIAFGVTDAGESPNALVSTYRFFEADPESERQRILRSLDAARVAAGVGPSTFVAIPELEAAADALESGGLGPDEALGRAVDAALPRFGRLRAFLSAGSDVDHLAFPPELVRDPRGQLGLSVVHYRPEGSAWGLYVVLGLVIGG